MLDRDDLVGFGSSLAAHALFIALAFFAPPDLDAFVLAGLTPGNRFLEMVIRPEKEAPATSPHSAATPR